MPLERQKRNVNSVLTTCFTLIIALMSSGCAIGESFLPARPMPSADLDATQSPTRLAFGSCFDANQSGDIFRRISQDKPDAFIFLGDNVYAADESDDPTLKSLREAYASLADDPDFAALRSQVPVLPTWDDHDLGLDDAGGDWPHLPMSTSLFKHVWAVSKEDERASRTGVYFARTVGAPGRRVQVIVLDTRSFRTPLTRHADQSIGRYTPSLDADQSMLGEAQWQWLALKLSEPAELRIIVTSIQMLADGHHWEAWHLMPLERQRFYTLLQDTDANGVILVSGDRHAASMYMRDDLIDYPLYELTSSSLNLPLSAWVPDVRQEPGPHRLGDSYFDSNYGLLDLNWDEQIVKLRIMDTAGHPVQERIVSLQALR